MVPVWITVLVQCHKGVGGAFSMSERLNWEARARGDTVRMRHRRFGVGSVRYSRVEGFVLYRTSTGQLYVAVALN